MSTELKNYYFNEVLAQGNVKLLSLRGGPFAPDSFDQKLIDSLKQLAEESFPDFTPEEIVRDDFLGRDLLYLLMSQEKLIGASSRQLQKINYKSEGSKLLYLCSSAIFKEFRGRGMSAYFYIPVFEDVNPDIVATTTNSPAIYKMFTNLAITKGLTYTPKPGNQTITNLWELGKLILAQSGRNPDQLDQSLVRRNYLPQRSSTPYLGFEFFEKNLNLKPEDGVLLIAKRAELDLP